MREVATAVAPDGTGLVWLAGLRALCDTGPVRRLAVACATILFVALTAGCGGGSDDSAGVTAATTTAPKPAVEVGEALRSFVEAAGTGEVDTMWELLSAESKDRLGPTREQFGRELGGGFEKGLGSFAGTSYQVVLSVEMPSGWGVAAVAGPRVRSGKEEFAAYGVALRQEDGRWKLELGDPVEIRTIAPDSLTTPERRPAIQIGLRADVAIDEAGLWLDGAALPGRASGNDARDVTVQGTPASPLSQGWHVVVAFARAGDLAAAGASPFQVEAGEGAGPIA